MKRHILAAAAVVVAGAACEPATSPTILSEQPLFNQGGNSGPSVNAGGNIRFSGTEPDEVFTGSFHAQIRPDGTVDGMIQFHNRALNPPWHIRGDIDCLTMQGNIAGVGGVITASDRADRPAGRRFYFRMRDNGEGAGSSADELSPFLSGTSAAFNGCAISQFGPALPWLPLTGGNMQVKP